MYVSGMSLSIYPLPDNFDMRGSRGGLGSPRGRGSSNMRGRRGSPRGRGFQGRRGFEGSRIAEGSRERFPSVKVLKKSMASSLAGSNQGMTKSSKVILEWCPG